MFMLYIWEENKCFSTDWKFIAILTNAHWCLPGFMFMLTLITCIQMSQIVNEKKSMSKSRDRSPCHIFQRGPLELPSYSCMEGYSQTPGSCQNLASGSWSWVGHDLIWWTKQRRWCQGRHSHLCPLSSVPLLQVEEESVPVTRSEPPKWKSSPPNCKGRVAGFSPGISTAELGILEGCGRCDPILGILADSKLAHKLYYLKYTSCCLLCCASCLAYGWVYLNC